MGKILDASRPCLGHLYGTFMEKICFKAPGNYSSPFGSITFRFAYGSIKKPELPWFRDFWTCHQAPKPTISLETPRHLQWIKKRHNRSFKHIIFVNLRMLGIHIICFDNFRKGGRLKMMKFRWNNLSRGCEIKIYQKTWNWNVVRCSKYLLKT